MIFFWERAIIGEINLIRNSISSFGLRILHFVSSKQVTRGNLVLQLVLLRVFTSKSSCVSEFCCIPMARFLRPSQSLVGFRYASTFKISIHKMEARCCSVDRRTDTKGLSIMASVCKDIVIQSVDNHLCIKRLAGSEIVATKLVDRHHQVDHYWEVQSWPVVPAATQNAAIPRTAPVYNNGSKWLLVSNKTHY